MTDRFSHLEIIDADAQRVLCEVHRAEAANAELVGDYERARVHHARKAEIKGRLGMPTALTRDEYIHIHGAHPTYA